MIWQKMWNRKKTDTRGKLTRRNLGKDPQGIAHHDAPPANKTRYDNPLGVIRRARDKRRIAMAQDIKATPLGLQVHKAYKHRGVEGHWEINTCPQAIPPTVRPTRFTAVHRFTAPNWFHEVSSNACNYVISSDVLSEIGKLLCVGTYFAFERTYVRQDGS